jgi:16S rRNA A1518/A1519 N6-dimethyltransferase RsmA/KsgA/DIM1 with predicted DNA glycosylase/AP lyase activity
VQIDPEEHELRALLARLPSIAASRIVEIGCGDGRLTRRYASRVGSVLAIDPDEALIASFRAGGVDPNVEVRAVGLEQVRLADAAADAIIFAWSL